MKNIEEIAFVILRKLGIEEVRASYDGYGDSGTIESVSFYFKNEEISHEDLEKKFEQYKNHLLTSFADDFKFFSEEIGDSFEALVDFLEEQVYSALPAGFEINEGSFGDVVINLKSEKIDVTQNDNEELDSEDWN